MLEDARRLGRRRCGIGGGSQLLRVHPVVVVVGRQRGPFGERRRSVISDRCLGATARRGGGAAGHVLQDIAPRSDVRERERAGLSVRRRRGQEGVAAIELHRPAQQGDQRIAATRDARDRPELAERETEGRRRPDRCVERVSAARVELLVPPLDLVSGDRCAEFERASSDRKGERPCDGRRRGEADRTGSVDRVHGRPGERCAGRVRHGPAEGRAHAGRGAGLEDVLEEALPRVGHGGRRAVEAPQEPAATLRDQGVMARITDLAADPGHSRDGSGVVDRDVRAAGGVQRRCAIRGNAHEVRSSPNGIERIDADRGCPANGVPAARPADIEPECPEERVAALADADRRHPGSGDVIRGRGRTPRAEVARFVADDDGSVSGEVRGLGLRDRQLIDREPIRREEGRERITDRSVG